MNRLHKLRLPLICLICALYVALRLWDLAASCLWFDEIFSIHAAEHAWQDLFWFVAQDLIHPPLFYVLLKIWILIGGTSLFWLRFFPVFWAILAVPPFLLLCRQLKLSFLTTVVALVFFAVNGSLIKYAQEVRMYSLLLCLALFSLWLFARFSDTGKNYILLIAVNIALVYSHYFGWLVIASEILAVLILARGRLKQILLMLFIALASFAPWLYAVRQAAKVNADVGQNIGWMPKPTVASVFQFVRVLFEPIYFEQSNADSSAILLITLPIIVIAIIAGGLYATVWKTEDAAEKRTILRLVIFTAAPVSAAFAASLMLPYSIWGTRHLIIVFAPFVILLALVFSKIKLQIWRTTSYIGIFLLIAAAFLIQSLRSEPKYIWCAWENLALNLNAVQPTKIYVFEDLVAYHFWFARRTEKAKFQIVKINGIEGLAEDKAYFLPRGFGEIQTANEFAGERFFIAYRDKTFNENAAPLKNLIALNYEIGAPQIFEAQGFKAFLVEIKKRNNF